MNTKTIFISFIICLLLPSVSFAQKAAQAQRQLATVQNGKTYYFNSVYEPYGGKWQMYNKPASIRFMKNTQTVYLSVSGSFTTLRISEVTKDGEISCYEAGNPLYGSWYITIMTINGKKAFKCYRPLGDIQYLLKNPYKVK